jgi:hypothetical protein
MQGGLIVGITVTAVFAVVFIIILGVNCTGNEISDET